jgi:hypothetical protein
MTKSPHIDRLNLTAMPKPENSDIPPKGNPVGLAATAAQGKEGDGHNDRIR